MCCFKVQKLGTGGLFTKFDEFTCLYLCITEYITVLIGYTV